MPYDPTVWVDDTTPLSAANLNKIEEGIDDAHTAIDNLAPAQFAYVDTSAADTELVLPDLDAATTVVSASADGFGTLEAMSTPTVDGARVSLFIETVDGATFEHDAASVGAGMSKLWMYGQEDIYYDVGQTIEFVHFGGYWNQVQHYARLEPFQVVWTAKDNEPPASSFATLDTRNSHPCLDFDAGATESAVFSGSLPPGYTNGGFYVQIIWAATSATSGNVMWQVSLENMTGLDLDGDSFDTVTSVTAAAQATNGVLRYTAVSVALADTDGIVSWDAFRIKVSRVGADGSDTMTGDAELFMVTLEELL
jgi:hypothetical protein